MTVEDHMGTASSEAAEQRAKDESAKPNADDNRRAADVLRATGEAGNLRVAHALSQPAKKSKKGATAKKNGSKRK